MCRGTLHAKDCAPLGDITPFTLNSRFPITRSISMVCFAAGIARGQVYTKHSGKNCKGTKSDVLRDFAGTAAQCKTKCDELECVGFVRVNSGSGSKNGKCFFRGGWLKSSEASPPGDNRDCYEASGASFLYLFSSCFFSFPFFHLYFLSLSLHILILWKDSLSLHSLILRKD